MFPSLNKFNKLLRNKGPGKSYSSQDDKEEDSLFCLHLLQLTLTYPSVGANVLHGNLPGGTVMMLWCSVVAMTPKEGKGEALSDKGWGKPKGHGEKGRLSGKQIKGEKAREAFGGWLYQ